MKRLKLLRQSRKMTQLQLAEALNVTQQSIHKYENNICSPSIESIAAIADYFGTSIDYLMEVTDIPYRYDDIPTEYMTPEEKNLLYHYRNFSAATKALIQQVLSEHDQQTKNV